MRRIAACAVLGLAFLSAPAVAQDDLSASESAVARQYFRAGVTAANAERWQEAAANFERAYALVRRPLVLLNLALARERLGRLVSAAETYRQFISDASSDRERGYIADAEAAASRIEARLAHLRLDLPGISPEHIVELSGRPISQLVLDAEIPLDPGRYVVVVRTSAGVRRRAVITLAERERRSLRIADGEIAPDQGTAVTPTTPSTPADRPILDTAATLDAPDTPPPDPGPLDPTHGGRYPQGDGEESSSVFESPWFWGGVGAIIAGTIVTIVIIANDAPADPWPGGDAPAVRF